MPTVNHVRLSNLGLNNNQNGFRGFWELTRAMQKAGWKFKGSSNGTTFTTSSDPELDQWNLAWPTAGGVGATGSTLTNAGGAAASIVAPANGRAQVNGLTGIVAADKGRFIKISGSVAANNHYHQIEEIVSATQVKINALTFAVVAAAGPLTWDIRDPTKGAFPAAATPSSTVAWWSAQGPSVLKIPITAASVGVFQRGENISQASTGATGEVLGYTYYNNTGWLVVAPRVRGTGTGVQGWQTAFVITGSKSLATVTQVGTAIEFVYEIVVAKPANQTTIQILVGQFDTAAATAFSTLTPTAATHPGGGGASNAFPIHAWVMWGSDSIPGAGVVIVPTIGARVLINAHVICVDAIPEAGYSADGSWFTALSITDAANPVTLNLGCLFYGFQRVNDIEDGEVSPYVSIAPGGAKTLYGNNRLNAGSSPSASFSDNQGAFGFHDVTLATTRVAFSGWRGRGLSSELFVEFEIAALGFLQTAFSPFIPQIQNQAIRQQASASRLVKARERIWLVNTTAPFALTKGSLKWVYWVCGDQFTDTYGVDPNAWVQLAASDGGTGTNASEGGAMVVGPYDGTPWLMNQGE